MTDTRRTAYWTRQQQQPADRTVCWTDLCPNPAAAVQSERLLGFYCADHTAAILADADRLTTTTTEGLR